MITKDFDKGDVVALQGAWTDLMTVEKIEDGKVYFTSGDYADLNKIRHAVPEEIEANCKIF
ncbi:hypothetical protein N0P26_000139 [Acinetobacter baumannii]|uniref:hypothetical protein n=1 Tax=Acinetobacter baumannii TaxID=470 RepID=UPI001D6FE546|nr:hypothetical protein [Acinetobacter baumannii]EKT9123478.1 hypothetical protein [Acinetobacter baumannii]EKT9311955.1 hypothetical protein [Acinetobacter baumannii]EKU0107707.1 hypothetical protein [Acinetobacter baumannii]EKU0260064.1 hypothetical protein [Acinetobacter baumannii]EKU3007892.1 hypothetical protein [Acinetobacter baumannii]